MNALPTGDVTFVFTDVVGSTTRWEHHPEAMAVALARHDAILRDAIERSSGVLYETAGDSFLVAFADASDALSMALRAQSDLIHADWPEEIGSLPVRITLHTGRAEMTPVGYAAQHTLSRQSRLLAVAHGGQILLSGPTHDRVASSLPPGVELRDLGELWLQDLIEAEHVFQVVADAAPWSLPDDFPVLRGERTLPGNVPTSSVPFIGRRRALRELTDAVVGGSDRLTTLTGPGGIGKTRLAVQTSALVQHLFVDGVFFVDVSALSDPDLVLAAIAGVIDPEGDEVSSATELAERLVDRRMLLVLDNLEQVVTVAAHVDELLRCAPELRILATSRIPLQLPGEREYPVPPLALPGDGETLAILADSEAVSLFVERAAASRPQFDLTPDNIDVVAAICRRLDGIPLALVLAAARIRVLSPTSMLERLDDRLALLRGGGDDLPARHQTLWDTIEWSHELLSEDERDFYGRCSVFAGGFRIETAEAMARLEGSDPTIVLDHLATLVDNSLLTTVETADGELRYRMLETIGEHAGVKLAESGDGESTRHLHLTALVDFAEQGNRELEGPDVVRWSRLLEEEHDNLRAALAFGFEHADGDPERADLTLRLATALGLFWLDRGHLHEGHEHLRRALALSERLLDDDDTERARRAMGHGAALRELLGGIAKRRGDLDEAKRLQHEAVGMFRSLGDPRGEGRALGGLATAAFTAGDLDEARHLFDLSLERADGAGDHFTAAGALLGLGNIARDSGDIDQARPFYERCLALVDEIHDVIGQSVVRNNLANLELETGRLDRAEELHATGLELRLSVGNRMMVAESLIGLGALALARGEHGRAMRLIGHAEAEADLVGGRFDPMERRLYERSIAILAETMQEGELAAELAAGRAMPSGDVVELALRGRPRSAPGRR